MEKEVKVLQLWFWTLNIIFLAMNCYSWRKHLLLLLSYSSYIPLCSWYLLVFSWVKFVSLLVDEEDNWFGLLDISSCPCFLFVLHFQTDYKDQEKVGTLDCGHEYHVDCIKMWLVVKNTCPICKSTALTAGGKDLWVLAWWCLKDLLNKSLYDLWSNSSIYCPKGRVLCLLLYSIYMYILLQRWD